MADFDEDFSGLECYTLLELIEEIKRRFRNTLVVVDGIDPGDENPSIQVFYNDRYSGIGLAEKSKQVLLDGFRETQFRAHPEDES